MISITQQVILTITHTGRGFGKMPSEQRKPIEIFFSYSHKDQDLRDQLEVHLNLLKRQGFISSWHDRQIGAGEEWAKEIDVHLNTADIILLLISADFIASNYCYEKEMMRALERNEIGETRVIPVILRPCDWYNSPFGKLQALPTGGQPVTGRSWHSRDEAFSDVSQGIRETIKEIIGSSKLPNTPLSNNAEPPQINIADALRDMKIYYEHLTHADKLIEYAYKLIDKGGLRFNDQRLFISQSFLLIKEPIRRLLLLTELFPFTTSDLNYFSLDEQHLFMGLVYHLDKRITDLISLLDGQELSNEYERSVKIQQTISLLRNGIEEVINSPFLEKVFVIMNNNGELFVSKKNMRPFGYEYKYSDTL